MHRFYRIFMSLLLASIIFTPPCFAEDLTVFGTLTVKPDTCTEPPSIARTSWTGTMDIVSALGYAFDENFAVSITSQNAHLFTGLITAIGFVEPPKGWEDVPFFGAFLNCRQIRVATGQTVLFAELNEDGNLLSGYFFSTDPLVGPPFDQPEPDPAMATFELGLDCPEPPCLKPLP